MSVGLSDGYTVLMMTVEEENYVNVQKMLPNSTINYKNKVILTQHGYSALAIAIKSGYTDIAQLLIDSGADVNSLNNGGQSVIFIACWHNKVDCVRCLLNSGADLNLADQRGWTPLMISAYHGFEPLVRYLIQAGADVGHKDCFGKRAEDRAKNSTIKSILIQALKSTRSNGDTSQAIRAVNRTPSPKLSRVSQDSYSSPSIISTPETYRKPGGVSRSSSAKSIPSREPQDLREIENIRQDMDSYIKSSSQTVGYHLAENCLAKVKTLLQEEVVKIEREMQDEVENVLVSSVQNLFVKLRDNTLKWIDSVLQEKGIRATPTLLDKTVPKFNLKQRKPVRRDTEIQLPNVQLELDRLPNTKNLYLSKELPTAQQLTNSLLRHLDKHLDNATIKVETLCANFIQKTVQDKISRLKDFIIRDMQEHIDSLTTQLNRQIELLVRERMVEVVEALRQSEEPLSPCSPDETFTEEQKMQNFREMLPLSGASLISRLENKKIHKSQECPSPPLSPGRCKNMPRRPAVTGSSNTAKNATKV